MSTPSPLAQWISDQVRAGGESHEQFAVRIHVNPSGFHKFMRGEHKEVRDSTLAKIAGGLGMSVLGMLTKAGSEDPDELQAELAIFETALRSKPRPLWRPAIAGAVAFIRALPAMPPVSDVATEALPVSTHAKTSRTGHAKSNSRAVDASSTGSENGFDNGLTLSLSRVQPVLAVA